MNSLLELAARVEAASSNDVSLFSEIGAAVFGLEEITPSQLEFARLVGQRAFLDAAMTLVPEGWRVQRIGEQQESDERGPYLGYWTARLHWPLGGMLSNLKWGKSATPALALTAACLRAHAAKEERR